MKGRSPLWRYNYKILVGTGYWVIVLPVAASQIVTMWMMALSSDFTQEVGVKIAEVMTPILGAFLAAHCLAPEYRSGTGTVLASKPVSLHRVVTVRVALAMFAALVLTVITLGVCSIGLQRISLVEPILASLPPLWFMSMLALAFATLFRSAPAGFAAAAGLWIMDLVMGYTANPFLSVQGYRAALTHEPMADVWLVGKIVLLVVGIALLFWHGRLLPRLGRSADRVDVTRMAATVAGLLVAYCVSGAVSMVSYAYTQRGRMMYHDTVWLRRHLKAYGPLPVARLFGPAFTALVAEVPPDDSGRGDRIRLQQLERALKRWPTSMWAPSLALEVALQREKIDPVAASEDFMAVADRYGSSPLGPKALLSLLRMETAQLPDAMRLTAARRMITDYPSLPQIDTAATTLWRYYPKQTRGEEMLTAALAAAKAAPEWTQPGWHVTAAEVYEKQGKTAEANAEAKKALDKAMELQRVATSASDAALELRPHRPQFDNALREADAMLKRLAGAKG